MMEVIQNQYFETRVVDNLAIVKFKRDIFELVTLVDQSQKLIDFIRSTEHLKDIKGLLLLSDPACLGEEVYEVFMRKIIANPSDENKDKLVPEFSERETRFRQITTINRFIKFMANYPKISAVGAHDTWVTPFIGVFLVADLRFASPGATFSFAHQKYGLHPSGGLPYLMDHYLGHSKALEIMLSERLDADQAKSLGLVNRILPADNFEDECIRLMKQYLRVNHATLRLTKRLFNYMNKDLEEYFGFEASLINL